MDEACAWKILFAVLGVVAAGCQSQPGAEAVRAAGAQPGVVIQPTELGRGSWFLWTASAGDESAKVFAVQPGQPPRELLHVPPKCWIQVELRLDADRVLCRTDRSPGAGRRRLLVDLRLGSCVDLGDAPDGVFEVVGPWLVCFDADAVRIVDWRGNGPERRLPHAVTQAQRVGDRLYCMHDSQPCEIDVGAGVLRPLGPRGQGERLSVAPDGAHYALGAWLPRDRIEFGMTGSRPSGSPFPSFESHYAQLGTVSVFTCGEGKRVLQRDEVPVVHSYFSSVLPPPPFARWMTDGSVVVDELAPEGSPVHVQPVAIELATGRMRAANASDIVWPSLVCYHYGGSSWVWFGEPEQYVAPDGIFEVVHELVAEQHQLTLRNTVTGESSRLGTFPSVHGCRWLESR